MATIRENATMAYKWLDGKLVTTILGTSRGDVDVPFDPAKASAVNRARAHNFGWQQRGADGGAVERKEPKTGRLRTDVEMADIRLEKVTAIFAHYETGSDDWPIRVAAAGVDAGLTIRAIMRWKECDADAANLIVGNLATKRGIERNAALKLFAGTKQVIDAVAAIRAEAASVDGDDLIEEASAE